MTRDEKLQRIEYLKKKIQEAHEKEDFSDEVIDAVIECSRLIRSLEGDEENEN